jgi:branched-chain amino acid transport system permease protein
MRVRSGRMSTAYFLVLFFACLAIIGQLPLSRFALHVLILAMIFAAVAASWDLLVGYAGQLSFGQAALFAVGGYAAALLNAYGGVNPWLSLPIAGIITAVVGGAFGLPALRVRGPYLALTTLAFGTAVEVILSNWTDVTGGPGGFFGYDTLPGVPSGRQAYFYLAIGFCAMAIALLYYLAERTTTGLVWTALRDDELRARTLGMGAVRYKMTAFVVSAFVAGCSGAFYANYIGLIAPTMADIVITTNIVAMAVIGGRGTIVGALVGAVVLVHFSQYLRGIGVVFNDIATGAFLIVVMAFIPSGIVGVIREWSRRRSVFREQGSV